MNSYKFNTHTLTLNENEQDIEVRDISDGLPGSLKATFPIDEGQDWLKIWRDGDQLKIDRVSDAPSFTAYSLDEWDFAYTVEGGILAIDIRDPTRATEPASPISFPLDTAAHYLLLRMNPSNDLHIYYNA
jgi:hypothetical protein